MAKGGGQLGQGPKSRAAAVTPLAPSPEPDDAGRPLLHGGDDDDHPGIIVEE
jgi:hypothetical protein